MISASSGRVTVEEYHRLPEFNENGRRTELIRGVIIEKKRKVPLHSFLACRLFEGISRALPVGYILRFQDPLTLADSEPEPDLSVIRGHDADFKEAHPLNASLVVEVAVSSVELDRELASLYAEAGVEEYWIVLGREQVVEVYCRHVSGVYQEKSVVQGGGILSSTGVPGLAVSLSELFA